MANSNERPERRKKETPHEAMQRLIREADKGLDNGPYDWIRQRRNHGNVPDGEQI